MGTWANTKTRILFTAICIVLLAVMLHQRTFASPNNDKFNYLNFEYSFQDPSIKQPSQLPSQILWQPLNPQRKSLEPVRQKILWLKMTLPPTHGIEDPAIRFNKLYVNFKAFINDQTIHSFGDGIKYPGLPIHLVPVPRSEQETVVWFRVESTLPMIGPRGEVILGSKFDIIVSLLKADVSEIFLICILSLVAISGLLLFLFYRNVRTYLNLSLFSLSCGAYFFGRLPTKIFYDIDPVLSGHIGLCGMYSCTYFFLNFYVEIFSLKHLRVLSITRKLSAAFAILSLTMSFFLKNGPLALLVPFFGVAVLVFSVVIYTAVRYLKDHPNGKTFYLGCAVLLGSGIWEIAREFGLFQVSWPMMTWGFIGLVISFVVIQGRVFAGLFKQVSASGLAAEQARARLERVLLSTHQLSRTHDLKSLIQAFAETIIVELKLVKQNVEIDFFFTSNKNYQTINTLKNISYLYCYNDKVSFITDESEDSEERLKFIKIRDRIRSLSGQYGQSNQADRSSLSILTIPLLSEDNFGAVTIRKHTDGEFKFDDVVLLKKFVNSLTASLMISLQNIEYVLEVAARARVESELDAATSLQEALLPPPLNLDCVKYSAYCKSAGKTGGDWHGYFHCKIRNRLFLTVGDVTGHDFAASIVTGVAAGAVKAWEQNDAHRFDISSEALEDLARLVNNVLCESNRGLKFMSMLFICIDLETGKFAVLNAGHPHPYYISKSATSWPIVSSGHILGLDSQAQFKSELHRFENGDSILIFTDGLLENQSVEGHSLSRRGLLKILKEHSHSDIIVEEIVSSAQKIWGNGPVDDDVTVVAVTWNQSAKLDSLAA